MNQFGNLSSRMIKKNCLLSLLFIVTLCQASLGYMKEEMDTASSSFSQFVDIFPRSLQLKKMIFDTKQILDQDHSFLLKNLKRTSLVFDASALRQLKRSSPVFFSLGKPHKNMENVKKEYI